MHTFINTPLRYARRVGRIPRIVSQRTALRALRPPYPIRIIVGSSSTRYSGWTSTDREVLDLLDPQSWSRYFSPDSVDAILAEHVWEHLELSEASIAARTCLRYLRPGSHLRLAVPDGFHPDVNYVEAVKPGGFGAGASDHKVLYTHVTLRALFIAAGFEVTLLEHFDEDGRFHFRDWDPVDGMIRRSSRFDARNQQRALAYTSIVIDAIKPTGAS